MNQEEQGKKMNQLIAKCWSDEGFKQKLLADPAAVLQAEGMALPAGLSVKALENTDTGFYLVIPAKPTGLSDEDLDKVAGGQEKMNQLFAKCWSDEGFKQKLLADPSAVLQAEGMALPAGLSVKALENTDTVFHLVIPAKPTDLSDEDLDKVTGGYCSALFVTWGPLIGVSLVVAAIFVADHVITEYVIKD